MENPGRVFSREQLLDGVWGRDVYIDERTVDVHVGRLRKALNRGRAATRSAPCAAPATRSTTASSRARDAQRSPGDPATSAPRGTRGAQSVRRSRPTRAAAPSHSRVEAAVAAAVAAG